jgi:DNA-binding transcriptional LysR family regulator
VLLTPAGKSFLNDARRILEDCDGSIKKAQRISRGEIGELAFGYMSALTHDFFAKALAEHFHRQYAKITSTSLSDLGLREGCFLPSDHAKSASPKAAFRHRTSDFVI